MIPIFSPRFRFFVGQIQIFQFNWVAGLSFCHWYYCYNYFYLGYCYYYFFLVNIYSYSNSMGTNGINEYCKFVYDVFSLKYCFAIKLFAYCRRIEIGIWPTLWLVELFCDVIMQYFLLGRVWASWSEKSDLKLSFRQLNLRQSNKYFYSTI